jgi:hypothetical protein
MNVIYKKGLKDNIKEIILLINDLTSDGEYEKIIFHMNGKKIAIFLIIIMIRNI